MKYSPFDLKYMALIFISVHMTQRPTDAYALLMRLGSQFGMSITECYEEISKIAEGSN